MPNEEDKSTQGRKIEDPPFLAVHISWRDDIAAYPEQAVAAFFLALIHSSPERVEGFLT